MLTTLVLKELRGILASPKFPVTLATVTLLILLSVFVGIQEYRSAVRQYETATALVQLEMREARSWMALNNRVYRQPDPMQIFAAGVEHDIGRTSAISAWQPVKLLSAAYTNDPLYAVFRTVDVAFIVSVVLTLLALLFTYDAISGEREDGTLQLTFANAVPRATYLLAKFIGSWVGLASALLVPLALSLSLLLIYRVPLTGEHWLRIGAFVAASGLLFTLFLAFGIFVSTLTRRSNVSFLVALTSWVALVLIVPRAGVMIAGQLSPVPSVAEVESQQDGFSKDRWEAHMKSMGERWRERERSMEGLNADQRKDKREEMEWTWAEEDDQSRKKMQAEIDEHARKLREDLRNRKREQERLAFLLSRFSPASAYQLAVMNLAGTDVRVKGRYEDGITAYRTTYNAYRDKKQRESGSTGGIRISVDSNSGIKIDAGRELSLDLSDMPQFSHPRPTFREVVAASVVDVGWLGLTALLAFAGAFVAFLRYDVR
jgi:ABC-type transport system involved in multi-copper enzyme maturation permease subunit